MPPNVKICTFSLFPDVIKKLEALCEMKHTPNKSRVLTLLIETEYRRLKAEDPAE